MYRQHQNGAENFSFRYEKTMRFFMLRNRGEVGIVEPTERQICRDDAFQTGRVLLARQGPTL